MLSRNRVATGLSPLDDDTITIGAVESSAGDTSSVAPPAIEGPAAVAAQPRPIGEGVDRRRRGARPPARRGPAVSTVLTYRLATYWLPVLPGWLAWWYLQRKDYL